MEPLAYLTAETASDCDAAVIWLHGLGADATDFMPVVPYLQLADGLRVRFIFPNAPIRPVTVNGGWRMRAWYDIEQMNATHRQVNRAHVQQMADAVQALVSEQQATGIARERILLVGFSQGGAVAYQAGLTATPPIGGVAGLSTYLALQPGDEALTARSLPLLVLHGQQDEVVAPRLGETALSWLRAAGFAPHYHQFPMGHEVTEASLQQLGRWINQLLYQGVTSDADQ